ncbi:hypothetical protein CEXT_733571 [Caerostris extrusa]|uniref:Ribosomal protein S3 n=1 Tax=Caerostris extrusa TaxID=172846 RepID=A0AAV4U1M6_CAEEX|nr:hypothetical protein CEXT_733571 [Caerostris extrusa]
MVKGTTRLVAQWLRAPFHPDRYPAQNSGRTKFQIRRPLADKSISADLTVSQPNNMKIKLRSFEVTRIAADKGRRKNGFGNFELSNNRTLNEVCGTRTLLIWKNSLEDLFGSGLEFRSVSDRDYDFDLISEKDERNWGFPATPKLLETEQRPRHFRTFSPRSSKSRTPARVVHFSKILFDKNGVNILISGCIKVRGTSKCARMKSEFLMRLAGFSSELSKRFEC